MNFAAVGASHLRALRRHLLLKRNGRNINQLVLLHHQLRFQAQDFVMLICIHVLKVTRRRPISRRLGIRIHG